MQNHAFGNFKDVKIVKMAKQINDVISKLGINFPLSKKRNIKKEKGTFSTPEALVLVQF